MLLQGVRKGSTCFNISTHLEEDLFKGGIFLLVAEDFQTLHQGKTSINHGGKLSCENYHILAGHFWLEKFYVFQKIFRFFFKFRRGDPDFFEMGTCGLNIGSFNYA